MSLVLRSLAVLAAFLSVHLVHCGGGGEEDVSTCGGKVPQDCDGSHIQGCVIYGDSIASDEAIVRVWDRICRASALEGAAAFVSPAGGAQVALGELELVWEQTLALAPPSGDVPARPRGTPGPIVTFGLAEAWAHLPPVTGWTYLIELRPEEGDSLWIYTVESRWKPDAVVRSHLAPGTWTASITSAYLNRNVVEEGPWLGGSITFELVGDRP